MRVERGQFHVDVHITNSAVGYKLQSYCSRISVLCPEGHCNRRKSIRWRKRKSNRERKRWRKRRRRRNRRGKKLRRRKRWTKKRWRKIKVKEEVEEERRREGGGRVSNWGR